MHLSKVFIKPYIQLIFPKKKLACLFCHFKCILDEPHNSLVEAISTWRFLHHFSLIASRRSGNCHVLGLEQWLSPNETSPIKWSPIHLRVFDRDHYALENSSLLLHSPLYASLESKSEHYIQPNLFITRNLLSWMGGLLKCLDHCLE